MSISHHHNIIYMCFQLYRVVSQNYYNILFVRDYILYTLQVFIYLLFTYTPQIYIPCIRKLKCCFISNHDLQFNTFSNKVKKICEKKTTNYEETSQNFLYKQSRTTVTKKKIYIFFLIYFFKENIIKTDYPKKSRRNSLINNFCFSL